MTVQPSQEKQLVNALSELSRKVKKTIKDGISNRRLKPQMVRISHRIVENFRYTDNGVTYDMATTKDIMKSVWHSASFNVEKSVKQYVEYTSALKLLTEVFTENKSLDKNLERFTSRIIWRCFYDAKFIESDIKSLITVFLNDIRGKPVKCGAKVELDGIVLRPKAFNLGFGVKLRQTTIEDLEKEIWPYQSRPFFIPPSAIMEFEFFGRHLNEIQEQVKKAVAILRLFKVGSVKDHSFRMYSDLITSMSSATVGSSVLDRVLEKYLITREDVDHLKKFFQKMNSVIPKSFFRLGLSKVDYLTIAYNRYCDALLQNGVLERRIANVVFGLEALFLEESRELKYRLTTRMCKILSNLGYDPYSVKEAILDAYDIRSTFTHGGQLSSRRRRRLEVKYETIKSLLMLTLNYLRVSLVVMINCSKTKRSFLKLVDCAIIDQKKEEELSQHIATVKNI